MAAANADNLATLGRLEKLKIAARPARIDANYDVDISILNGIWVVYAERVTYDVTKESDSNLSH